VLGLVIVKQFKGVSLWGFSDTYEITIPNNTEKLDELITAFFLTRKAKKQNGLVFRRGNRFWTWFNVWSELAPLQTIDVLINNKVITLKYQVHGGFWIRFPPFHFEKEAKDFELYLSQSNS
jgi:hypothetical protein